MKPYTEKLARLIYTLAIIAIFGVFAWYFKSVLVYIAASLVVALIARPISDGVGKVKVKGRMIPQAVRNILAMLTIIAAIICAIAGLTPVMTSMVSNISAILSDPDSISIGALLSKVNEFAKDTFNADPSFKIEDIAYEHLEDLADISRIGGMLGIVASAIASVAVAVFAVVFISFFFIKDRHLFKKFVLSLVPDRMEQQVDESISQSSHLLSRYFAGLALEMLIVGLIDFLGLWLIAGLDIYTSLGIGFMAGLLNIIPYLGPWIGAGLGGITALLMRFNEATAVSGNEILSFLLIFAGIFLASQLVDNYLLQPIIYSKSVKASPLETFFVILFAGAAGGIVGMLVAIPFYTVARVFAINLFPESKFIKFLES